MTQRERTMATVLGGGSVFAVGFFGFLMFYNAYVGAEQSIVRMKKDLEESTVKLATVRKDAVKLERWRRLSLGGDLEQSRVEYRDYLTNQLRKYGLTTNYSFEAPPADSRTAVLLPGTKTPVYTGLNFFVRFKAKMTNLVSFIQAFQAEPKMHRIKAWTIERSDDKKDDMLTVSMTFEALAILDAKKSINANRFFPDLAILKWETKSFIAGTPSGLALVGWAVGPNTPRLDPLNPPLTAVRKYAEITYRNPFVGFIDVKGEKDNKKGGPPPRDDSINFMRFNRLVSLIDEDGNREAWLWNIFHNQKERLKNKAGFRTFPLVRTEAVPGGKASSVVVYGDVIKIEDYDLIFRVSLKAEDAKRNKWWRYPETNNFFTLHKEDQDWLIHKEEKAGEGDRGNLYLVTSTYWEKLTRKDKGKIEIYKDGVSFRVVGDATYGRILWSDSKIVIILMDTWPPASAPLTPSIGASRVYPDADLVYHIDSKHFDDLMAKKLVKKEEINRVYAMRKDHYDFLRQQKIITGVGEGGGGKGGTFTFYKDLIYCDLISQSNDLVVFRVAEQYCHCPANTATKTEERWHEGFCVLRLRGFVQEALETPLSVARTKELLKEMSGEGHP